MQLEPEEEARIIEYLTTQLKEGYEIVDYRVTTPRGPMGHGQPRAIIGIEVSDKDGKVTKHAYNLRKIRRLLKQESMRQ